MLMLKPIFFDSNQLEFGYFFGKIQVYINNVFIYDTVNKYTVTMQYICSVH